MCQKKDKHGSCAYGACDVEGGRDNYINNYIITIWMSTRSTRCYMRV